MLVSQAVLLAFAAAAEAAVQMKQVDSVNRAALVSQGWAVSRHVLLAEQEVTLQIGLTLQNTDTMINRLLDVSDPKSKSYGKWLDRDDVNKIVQPTERANEAVTNWLKAEGVSKIQSDGTWVTFRTTIDTANRILGAEFRQYEREGVYKIRTTEYSVPKDVYEHIDIIHPTTFFGKTEPFAPTHVPETRKSLNSRQAPWPAPGAPATSGGAPASVGEDGGDVPKGSPYFTVDPSCARGITPACINQMYNIKNYTPSVSSGSRLAFGSFLNQSSIYEDLALYQKYYKLPAKNLTKIFVNQAQNNQAPETADEFAGEANLDVQLMAAVSSPLPLYEYLTGGSPPIVYDLEQTGPEKNTNEPYLPYYQYLLAKTNDELPQVISNSYGEPEQTVPYRYAARTCNMIAMLGLRGITIMESSGDTGIGSYCRKNDGSNKPYFLPDFPSSCPWITSIGGTEAVSPEIAWRDSSGGFSDYFQAPLYQRSAVREYLYNKLPRATLNYYKPYFDARGRGFPDVSAHSLYPVYRIVVGGYLSGSGGTSAASPVVAGIIALLNDARFKKGLPSLGFINPWLYGDGEKFLVDIKEGAARGCDGVNHQSGKVVNGSAVIPGAFWNATEGWDAATGMGVFDFQKALKSALSTP